MTSYDDDTYGVYMFNFSRIISYENFPGHRLIMAHRFD